MSGYNQITLVGNIGNDAEMKFADGKPVTTFPLAVNGKKDETQWFTVTTWEKLAETCNEYIHKGMKVLVVGRVKLDEWTGSDSVPRARLSVTANNVTFLDSKVASPAEEGAAVF